MILGYKESYLKEMKGYITAKEIAQQPRLWNETVDIISKNCEKIENFLKKLNLKNTTVILTGAGTSEFVGNTLVPYLRKITGLNIESRATTDIVANPEQYIPKDRDVLLISFARSGNSPESIGAVEIAEKVTNRISHLFITCNAEGKLAKKNLDNSLTILMPKDSNDAGFAMTGSFSCMVLATCLIFDSKNFIKNKEEIKNLVNISEKNIVELRDEIYRASILDTERVVFLGSGSLKGLAQEASLKVLELCAGKIPSFYDTPLGFRHGPKSIVNAKTTIITLFSQDAYSKEYDTDLVNELLRDKKSSQIITLGGSNPKNDGDMNIVTGFHSENMILTALNYLIPCQIYSLMKSLNCGITPDNPCPTGEVNRVVQGVVIHEFNK